MAAIIGVARGTTKNAIARNNKNNNNPGIKNSISSIVFFDFTFVLIYL
jgi:hypothetical protein